uniref:Uncharacterized protein n=1 Tax=Rhizophora mucronata TaxID=61149 RepID=A0A2P2LAA1_RHIMU
MSALLIIFIFIVPVFLLFIRRGRSCKKLPPGSLGIPIIGQSIGLLRAMRTNTAEKWVEQRIHKYGPISKLTLFGKPTVFIRGQAANKFVFASDGNTLSNQQTASTRMILGDRNLLELSGSDHQRVRKALMTFLKPESLKQYVGKIDEEVRLHIDMHWKGKQEVRVLPLMKTLTFNIINSVLCGVECGPRRDILLDCFQVMVEGAWSIPVNLPFTRYNRSIRASRRVQAMVEDLVAEKKAELEQKGANSHQDLITCLLSVRDKESGQMMSEKEIVHNIMLIMTAGYDTSSVLLTFLIRLLSNEPAVYAAVVQGK